jgi:hypothetical protein
MEDRGGSVLRTLVGGDGQGKVEEIIRICEFRLHCRRKIKFCQVCRRVELMDNERCGTLDIGDVARTFLHPYLSGTGLGLLLRGRVLVLLHAPDLDETVRQP